MTTHRELTDDQRRGWTVVGTTFITLALVVGTWYCYSVFLVAFLREFGWSRSLVAGAFSVFVLVHGSCSPVIGWLAGRIGPRLVILAGGCVLSLGLLLAAETRAWWHLYLAFGGIAAVGITMAGWIPAVLLVRGWFPTRLGTVVGIASSGIGLGIFAVVPLTQFLIDRVGWRWAFRVLAVLIVGWVIPATAGLVQDAPSLEASGSPSGSRTSRPRLERGTYWTLATAIRDWHFWGLAGVYFTGNFVTQLLLVHQVAYLVDHGVSPLAAAAVGGVVGLASIPGKMGWGAFSDRSGRELAYSLSFACVVASIGVLALVGTASSSWLPYLYAVLIGLGYGGIAPITPAAASDLFGGPAFSTIFATVYTALTLGAASGAWAGGEIFDRTGSYALAFWVALGMSLLSPVLLWIVAPRRANPPPTRH
ncbi:MAG: MFS transporter [candidate division NC10 bacterium]|nr:MFS transporter [candidate division NC10 bacterium]